MGLEPTTHGLQIRCATNYATLAYLGSLFQLLQFKRLLLIIKLLYEPIFILYIYYTIFFYKNQFKIFYFIYDSTAPSQFAPQPLEQEL